MCLGGSDQAMEGGGLGLEERGLGFGGERGKERCGHGRHYDDELLKKKSFPMMGLRSERERE